LAGNVLYTGHGYTYRPFPKNALYDAAETSAGQ